MLQMNNHFIVIVSFCAGVVFGPGFVKHSCYTAIKFLLMRTKTSIHRYILKPPANWSPYIFMLVQKVKNRVYKIHVFFK